MLEYNRIDVSEGVDIGQVGDGISRQCTLCNFWYYLDKILVIKVIYAMDVMMLA